MLTFEQIKELIEQVADRGLQGLEVERSGFRLKIEGQTTAPPAPAASESASAATPSAVSQTTSPTRATPSGDAEGSAAPRTSSTSAGPADAQPEAGDDGPPPGTQMLKSPIVGTFYRRPSPDADPFVQVGSRVKIGQVLCIVEAMKLMNEIESDVDGEIAEIYPENGQPVEYGEPLFAIKPD